MLRATVSIAMILSCALQSAAPSSRVQNDLVKSFIEESLVQYGGAEDAATLEGRLYGWAKSGASVDEMVRRAGKTFDMPPELAKRIVPLVLMRGASEDSKAPPQLKENFVGLALAYPQSRTALLEAADAIHQTDDYGACSVDDYERLLRGRPQADADRVVIFDHVWCLPLLTERTTLRRGETEPLIDLAHRGREIENEVLRLAVVQAADAAVTNAPDAALADEMRARHLVEVLHQGRSQEATGLLPSGPLVRRGLTARLDEETRLSIAAAYALQGQPERARAWRDVASKSPAPVSPGIQSEGQPPVRNRQDDERVAWERRALNRLLIENDRDPFDLLVGKFRLSDSSGYAQRMWAQVFARIATASGYAGLVHDEDVGLVSDADVVEARKDCYRCAPDLLAAIDRVAEGRLDAQRRSGTHNAAQPSGVVQLDARIDAPLHLWKENPLPAEFRLPHSVAKTTDDDLRLAAVEHPAAPAWASRLPKGVLIRYQQSGQRIVAITASQSLDPTGEISVGGYWVSLSDDGGAHFGPPLYTGLRIFEPYVVVAASKLPLLDGDRLRIEVLERRLDDDHVMLPPVRIPLKSRRDNLVLEASLADLQHDADGDGLSDVAEWGMLLDPNDADSDADGLSDGVDSLPQVPRRQDGRRRAGGAALAQVLNRMFGRSLGAIVTTDAASAMPEQAYALGAGTDRRDDAGAMFVVAPAEYFSAIDLRGRMIVLSPAQAKRLKEHRGLMFSTNIATFEVKHDGTQAIVVWSAGWTGGTELLTWKNGKWVSQSLQSWIT
jgi:hypothetical protein